MNRRRAHAVACIIASGAALALVGCGSSDPRPQRQSYHGPYDAGAGDASPARDSGRAGTDADPPSDSTRANDTIQVADAHNPDVFVDPERPQIKSVQLPQSPSGEVALRLVLADAQSDLVSLEVAVSLDNGNSWRAAHVAGRLTGLPTSPSGSQASLTWDALRDVGFHQPRRALLRFVAADAVGAGPATVAQTPLIDNIRVAASRVDHYMAYYGTVTSKIISLAETYQLAILHPHNGNITRAQIAAIQDGVDPSDPADDVIVLCYISVGEDIRTRFVDDTQMLADPRFIGDGSGPRIDPRGPNADGLGLDNIDPRGLPSNGGTGYASWYLDDNDVENNATHLGDGKPDRNKIFNGCFVNAGDPKWFDALRKMSIDGQDKVPGLDELLSNSYGRGLSCDGVFLDTFDTAAPNYFTDASSPNQSEFEWTAPGFAQFTKRLRATFPSKLILQNRGVFFFDPRQRHYSHSPRPHIDFLMFESYRLNSSSGEGYHSYFYPDNRYHYMPKLMAEANRPDGFKVLSLGYAEGPGIEHDTLLGTSTQGIQTLLEDIRVSTELAGFRHYITDAGLVLANPFVMLHSDFTDTKPPRWTSSYNGNVNPWPEPPDPPTPRVGVQQLEPWVDAITVRWDVAVDKHRVGYALYYQTHPFDFANDPALSSATRIILTPQIPANYKEGVGANIFANEAVIRGLPKGTRHYFVIRAFDEKGNEDDNQVVLSALPF